MQSTKNLEEIAPEETDPHDIFVIEPDVVLAARADKPAADPASPDQAQQPAKAPAIVAEDIMGDILSRPSTPKLRVVPDMAVAAPLPPSKPVPPVDTRFRATAATADTIAKGIKTPGEIKVASDIQVPSDIHLDGARPSRGAWAKRAIFGFLFALASVAAAEAWERYGDTATQMLAGWTAPLLALTSSQPEAAPATPAQPAQPAVQAAITDQAASPPAAAAIQPAQDMATAPGAPLPSAQALQSMTQDLAAMGQQIEELKATIAQLKAGQEQMAQQISRDIVKNAVARSSEAKPPEARAPERGHVMGAAPRPLAPPPVRKPPHAAYSGAPTATAYVPPPPGTAYPPPTAAPAPMPVPPVTTDPDGDLVVRPPMPLR